jgi:hypothetical protein
MSASINSFLYEHCDVPPGMSLKEWRASAVRTKRDRARGKRWTGRARSARR